MEVAKIALSFINCCFFLAQCSFKIIIFSIIVIINCSESVFFGSGHYINTSGRDIKVSFFWSSIDNANTFYFSDFFY